MLSDHPEDIHLCLSTIIQISLANHTSPVPSMHETLNLQPVHQLLLLSMLLITNFNEALLCKTLGVLH